jgi:hypothetical protein
MRKRLLITTFLLAGAVLAMGANSDTVMYDKTTRKVKKTQDNSKVLLDQTGTQTDAASVVGNRRAVTAGTTILSTDYLVAHTTLSAPATDPLPAANTVTGQVFIVKDEAGTAGTNNITISRAGSDTIDGGTTTVISTNYGVKKLYSTGASWFTIGDSGVVSGPISTLLDNIGTTRGSLLFRGASGWSLLPPGSSGQVVKSNGAGADPSYGASATVPTGTGFVHVTGGSQDGAAALVSPSDMTATALDQSFAYAADSGAANAYLVTLSPAWTSYVTGARMRFKATNANTAASTINVNGLGAKTIKKAAGGVTTDLAANDIRAGQIVELSYDGTNFQMQSTLGNAASGSGGANVQQTTLGSDASSSSSVALAGGKKTLRVIVHGRGATGTTVPDVFIQFNGDSTAAHYSWNIMANVYVSASSNTIVNSENLSSGAGGIGHLSVSAQQSSTIMVTVPDYTDTTIAHTFVSHFNYLTTTPHWATGVGGGEWIGTGTPAAITSLVVTEGAGANLKAGTIVTVIEE